MFNILIMYFYYALGKAIIPVSKPRRFAMAKTKIRSRVKEPDLDEMIRDYWESLEDDKSSEREAGPGTS